MGGQITTELPGRNARAISASRELELGARGDLLEVEGIFRLDACPLGDALRLVVRRLGESEVACGGDGYASPVVIREEQLPRLRAMRPSRFDLTAAFRGPAVGEATIIVGALRFPARGTTQLTAQAIVRFEDPLRNGVTRGDASGSPASAS